jgi:hypothetical protein|tara:strand:- start:608 stop:985 length:378 start_codon:yes stop_codon:yes gene_type:complete
MEKKLNKKNLIKDSDDMFFELMGNSENIGDFNKMMEVMQKKYIMSFSFFNSFLFLLHKETKKYLNEKERNYLKQLFGMELTDQNISEMLLGKIKYDPIKKRFYESDKRVRIDLRKGKIYEINDQR